METLSTFILIAAVAVFGPMIYLKIAGESASVLRKTFSLVITVIIAGVFSFVYHLMQNESFIEGVKQGYEKAQYYEIINDPNRREIGCLTKDQYNTVINMAAEQKENIVKEHMRNELKSGNCVAFERNETVKLIETEVFDGLVLLERSADKKQYWTGIESLSE